MKRRLSILVSCLMSIALCYGQTGDSPVQETPAGGQFVLSFTPGAGFELAFSRACTNISIPVELRLLPVGNHFNFALGERITMHRGRIEENTVSNYDYYSMLQEPYLTYDQISTAIEMPEDTDQLALPLYGVQKKLLSMDFAQAMEASGLNKQMIQRIFNRFIPLKDKWFACIDDSFISSQQKIKFKELISQRLETLSMPF